MNLQEMQNLSKEEQKELYNKLKGIRTKAKIVNFSALYGVSKDTLSRNSGLPIGQAKKLLDTYWKRNFSVRKFVETCEVKTINNTTWVKNPISGFWLSLRTERDIFSTVNQSSAVYLFDLFLKEVRNKGIKVPFQYHDEFALTVKNENLDKTKKDIYEAMENLNKKITLNVKLACSVESGKDYANIH